LSSTQKIVLHGTKKVYQVRIGWPCERVVNGLHVYSTMTDSVLDHHWTPDIGRLDVMIMAHCCACRYAQIQRKLNDHVRQFTRAHFGIEVETMKLWGEDLIKELKRMCYYLRPERDGHNKVTGCECLW
jgi:hypothetical protein